jgi:hypothetical protein
VRVAAAEPDLSESPLERVPAEGGGDWGRLAASFCSELARRDQDVAARRFALPHGLPKNLRREVFTIREYPRPR